MHTEIDSPEPVLNEEQFNKLLFNAIGPFVDNDLRFRRNLIESFGGRRTDIDAECGFVKTGEITPQMYRDVYERNGVAKRIVNLYPRECWQVCPWLYEDEDLGIETQFERAFAELGKNLAGVGDYEDNEGNPIWEYLERADILSGIGRYGVIIIGVDDPSENLETPLKLEDLKPQVTREYDETAEPTVDPKTGKKEKQVKSTKVSYPTKEGEDKTDPKTLDAGVKKLGVEEDGEAAPVEEFKPKHKLLFLRVLDEANCPVVKWEGGKNNPRIGQPELYQITVSGGNYANPTDMTAAGPVGSSITDSTTTLKVHWTRVIHLARDVESNEALAPPVLLTPWNNLYNLHKLTGGSAEMYWQGALPGLSFETHPSLGGDVAIDEDKMKQAIQQYLTRLQRTIMAPGMSVKSLAPQVVDPTPQVNVQLDQICIYLECPKRIFQGSERGELASSQDSRSWVGRVKRRQNRYVTARVIVPVIDRLIRIGVLPRPKQFFCSWPDIAGVTDLERADIAVKRTQAMSVYCSGGVDGLIGPRDYLVRELGYDEEEADQIIENKKAALEAEMNEEGSDELDIHAREDAKAEEEAARAAEQFDAQREDGGLDREHDMEKTKLQLAAAKAKKAPPK